MSCFSTSATGGVLHRVFGLSRGVMPLRMPAWAAQRSAKRSVQLVDGDWNHGILNDFPIILGMEHHPN